MNQNKVTEALRSLLSDESQVNLTSVNIDPNGSNIRFRKNISGTIVSTNSSEYLVLPCSRNPKAAAKREPEVGDSEQIDLEKPEKPSASVDSSTNDNNKTQTKLEQPPMMSNEHDKPNICRPARSSYSLKRDTNDMDNSQRKRPRIDSQSSEGTFECGVYNSDSSEDMSECGGSYQSTSEECESFDQMIYTIYEAPVKKPSTPRIVRVCQCTHTHLPPKDEMDVSAENKVPNRESLNGLCQPKSGNASHRISTETQEKNTTKPVRAYRNKRK